jgi:hypothetical protein
MANTTISKHARQAARQAAAAEAAKLAERNRANVEDLATFFNAHERAEGVDEWLAERQEALQQQAKERRSGFVRDGGLALRAMRDRGESVHGIATMTGLTDKAVRDAIREAEAIDAVLQPKSSPVAPEVAATPADEAPAPGTPAEPGPAAPTAAPVRSGETAAPAAS